jgi:ribonucleoside-diphosphate reductase alpha chain
VSSGVINVSQFVEDGEIDWDELAATIAIAVRFLDNLIDLNAYPSSDLETSTKRTRKINLGIIGFADLLIKLEVPYTSNKAIETAESLAKFIDSAAKSCSKTLGKERGNFPAIKESFLRNHHNIRNLTLTGLEEDEDIAQIVGVTSSIEPLQNMSPAIEGFLKGSSALTSDNNNQDLTPSLQKILSSNDSALMAYQLKIQASFQKYFDNLVINKIKIPQNATPKEIENVILMAYGLGIKKVGFTKTLVEEVKEREDMDNVIKSNQADPKEEQKSMTDQVSITEGYTIQTNTPCGSIYVTVNFDETGKPNSVFTHFDSKIKCAKSQIEVLSRLVMLGIKQGLKAEEIIKEIGQIDCELSDIKGGPSCTEAIILSLEAAMQKKQIYSSLSSAK